MKKCKRCQCAKPFSEFRHRSGSEHLYQSWCRECERKGMTSYKESIGKESQSNAERKCKASPKGRAALRKSIETRNLKYLGRVKARALVSRALKSGALVKWPVCAVPTCFDINVEAHHPDYSNPLEVVWLCASHHIEVNRDI